MTESKKTMKIVLIEDDVSACRDFADYARTTTEIVFVGMTGKSRDGLELAKNKLPEAVIVDLELNMGEGSGYDFLEELAKTELAIRPIIVITTRNRNDTIHTQLHAKYNINWIFYKLQKGYCPEMVIRHLLRFREFYHLQKSGIDSDAKTIETPEELKDRIMSRIKAEMDAFGISVRLKGRKYAEESIHILVTNPNKGDSVFQDVSKSVKNSYDNVIRAIQTAINSAWDNTDDIDELLKRYTAPVRKDKGTPMPTEFVHYYADKIRRDLF